MKLATKPRILIVMGVAAAASATGIVFASRGNAGPAPSPGITAGVSAVDRLPPVRGPLTGQAQSFVRDSARDSGMSEAAVAARVRLLRSNLGALHSDAYAFRDSRGSVCFIVTGRAGSCPQAPSNGSPGFQWTIGGGYESVPSALLGVVSDQVSAISLHVDGTSVPVTIKNNFAYGEFLRDARKAEITIHRRDGSSSSDTVNLQG